MNRILYYLYLILCKLYIIEILILSFKYLELQKSCWNNIIDF